MKQKDINHNFICALVLVSMLLFFNIGISLYLDGRLDKLEGQEQSPCYINVYDKTFTVGIPKGSDEYGYVYEDPSFRYGMNVEYIKRDLPLCDGTQFVDLITDIYKQEELIRDAKVSGDEQ